MTGVEIRVGDFSQDSEEQLIEHLVGVDILISFVSTKAITLQKNILKAAKKVGVKRVVPSDFGITCPPGRREIQDDVRHSAISSGSMEPFNAVTSTRKSQFRPSSASSVSHTLSSMLDGRCK